MSSPWKKYSSGVVYKNPWIKIREDKVRQPDGKRSIYGFMDISFTVGILALSGKKEIFLVKEYRYPLKKYTLEIPRGMSKRGETPLKAAKRELLEEVGYVAKRWDKLEHINTSPGLINEVCYIFLPRHLDFKGRRPDSVEKQTVITTSFKNALQWASNNHISDALTVTAIFRTKQLLKL